jgi:hypothetical protein
MSIQRIGTVNLLDVKSREDMEINSLVSFPDTEEGNKAAEDTFREWVKTASDEDTTAEEIELCVTEGVCEVGDGGLYIMHSDGSGNRNRRKS